MLFLNRCYVNLHVGKAIQFLLTVFLKTAQMFGLEFPP